MYPSIHFSCKKLRDRSNKKMPPKRGVPKALVTTAQKAAKKAPRPAATKKKQTPAKPAVDAAKKVPYAVSKQLIGLLSDMTADARSIVSFIMGPSCGLESTHNQYNTSTSFLIVVMYGRLDVVQLLLSEHSPNVKAVNALKRNALHLAARDSYLEIAKTLVEHGIDINAMDKFGYTPLSCAISESQSITAGSTMALLLLQSGANPNIPAKESKLTPLHLACKKGLVDVVKAMLTSGAQVTAVSTLGKTPLDYADEKGHTKLVSLLKGKA